MNSFIIKLQDAVSSIGPSVATVQDTSLPEYKAIWVDFDGTIAQGPWLDDPFQQPLCLDVVDELLRLKDADPNLRIMVFTARSWEDAPKLEKYLTHHNIPFDSVICGKPRVVACIDDLAVNPKLPDWQKHLEAILSVPPEVNHRH
jgi:hypothetical protein